MYVERERESWGCKPNKHVWGARNQDSTGMCIPAATNRGYNSLYWVYLQKKKRAADIIQVNDKKEH